MDDPFSPERKTVRLNKQNLFGSGYAGLGTNRHLTRRLLSVPADIQSGGKVAGERSLRVSDALSVRNQAMLGIVRDVIPPVPLVIIGRVGGVAVLGLLGDGGMLLIERDRAGPRGTKPRTHPERR